MSPTSIDISRGEIQVPVDSVRLTADLWLPQEASGLVLFSHGGGSSRQSPRNRRVAEILNDGRMGTILLDLLTEEEEATEDVPGGLRFDIELLARRLVVVTDWIREQPNLNGLHLGYFGASTGAAAALVAAAARPRAVRAVVSRGGRPELAGRALSRVESPCLFVVGSNDRQVLRLNREAIAKLPLRTERRLELVHGATHLFEEPGALEQVGELARDWFEQYLINGMAQGW
jgi:putative phosphoribosyl transferase